MDSRNVFVAIALSLAVLLFWSAFFETPKPIKTKGIVEEQKKLNSKVENNEITPNINQKAPEVFVSREDSINENERIALENEKVKGSISLKGGVFDDLSFKTHKKEIGKEDNVVFLNPKGSQDGYYVETGWTSVGNKIKVPTINSQWSVVGNKTLGVNKPLILEWNNNEGLIFRKQIELDEKAENWLIEEGFSSSYGARPLKRVIQNHIVDKIAHMLISNEINEKNKIFISTKNSELDFKIKL